MGQETKAVTGKLPQSGENQANKKAQKNSLPKSRGIFLRLCYFPAVCVFSELILRLCVYRGFPEGTVAASLFALALGCVWNLLTICFPAALNRVFYYLGLFAVALYGCVQLIYFTVFGRFFSFRLMFTVGADVLDFKRQIFHTMAARWYGIVLLFIPLLLRFLLDIYGFGFRALSKKMLLAGTGTALACYLFFLGTLFTGGRIPYSAWDLYFNDWETTLGTQKLGFFVAAGRDVKGVLFGGTKDDLKKLLEASSASLKKGDVTPVPTPPLKEGEEAEGADKTAPPTPTPAPQRFHELYDFAKLAEQEKNEEIKILHTYFAGQQPEAENEYTGMFEGYNLIMLTAEGFSPWAVDKELTPTLYRLTHSGFVFQNFYTPLWYTSTSDGEYVACTGLIPDGSNSMTRSAKNDMRFAFGNQFAGEGYLTFAYHNHSYTYYQRNRTHPNLGYTFKGIGNGLVLKTDCWPRSDFEMMEATLPEYIDKEPFHVYYMTVSGHMEYTFVDNSMAYRNRDAVKGLPYSDNAKAYLACNYELEKALAYLLEELEEKGIADHTVIALSADHYPYGLDKRYIDELAGHEVEENFELYKNYFVLWCAGMEETVTVDKYCSSLDIAPTLANLFGLSYDSRLYMGSDILSDREGLVIFDNKSFLTDKAAYNTVTGRAESVNRAKVTQEYLDEKLLEVKQKFAVSKAILVNDYFSYLPK